MNRIIVLTLCISIGVLTNFCSSSDVNDGQKENYRLTYDILPTDYIVDVTPYFDTNLNGKAPFTFDGLCTITIKPRVANVDTIALHKQYLNILEQTLTTAPNLNESTHQLAESVAIKSSEYNNVTNKYSLKLTAPLVKDKLYVLKFKYTGKLQTDYHGFFYDKYREGNTTRQVEGAPSKWLDFVKISNCFFFLLQMDCRDTF